MIDKSDGFNDAPPPYQHVLQSASDSKLDLRHSPNPSQTSHSSHSKRHPFKASKHAASPSRWFPTSIFGLSKTAKQVRSTTQDFLRDLLLQARPSEHEWLALLSNCSDTCNAQGLNFSTLLQEPFVEGHLPVYWAILKRPPPAARTRPPSTTTTTTTTTTHTKTDRSASPANNDDPDALVIAILEASFPINAASVADARLACVTVSDNTLFVRLGKRYEAFSPRSGTDRVLLGGSDTADTVSVEEARGAGTNISAAFTVHFSITQFQLRMRVSKQVKIEFIARGRLCYLTFLVASSPSTTRTGEWLISLGLSEPSSPTWVDARLSIVDRSPPPSPPSTLDPSSATYRMTQRAGLPLPPKHPTSGKHRNTASLPIKTSSFQISPSGPIHEVVVSLDKILFGATLQNDATSFVDAHGTLNAELEVKLQKTNDLDTNCIIC